MEGVIDGRRIKYEDNKLWVWREKQGRRILKKPYWREVKLSFNSGYMCVCINNRKYKYHRVVYYLHNPDWDIHDISRDNLIDHIDRNPLNNNIDNLRIVSNQQNSFNRVFKGYSFDKVAQKYRVRIMIDGKNKNLGYFTNEEDAHQAYLDAKKIYHLIV
jgi:hypothetical protein